MRPILPILMLTLLPGCAALSALQGEPDRDVFELRPPAVTATQCGRSRSTELVIEEPKTRGTLNSERILIRPSALQTQYLPDAVWGDTVPVTLQRLLVQALGRYDTFSHVGRAPLGLAGDVAMISEVTDFNAEVSGSGAVVKMTVDAQIVQEMEATVASRASFAVAVPAASTKTADLIPAFDQAGQQLTTQMTEWALKAVGVNPASCR